MNILYFWHSLDQVGGVEILIRNLGEQLANNAGKPHILIFKNGKLEHSFKNAGFTCHVYSGSRYNPMALLLFMVRLIKKYKITCIHSHEQFTSLVAVTVKLFIQINVICTFHIALHEHKRKVTAYVTSWIVKRSADYLVFVSKAVERSYATILTTNSQSETQRYGVIYNGIPISAINNAVSANKDFKAQFRNKMGLSSEDTLLVTVGRLTEQKGHIHLLKAFSLLLNVHPKMHLVIVGEGELEQNFQQYIRDQKMESKVTLLKPTSDVHLIIDSCDLFILPSMWEGFSLILLEAMSLSKPIIVSDATGVEEIVQHGSNGLVFQKGNIPELVSAIEKLLLSASLRHSLADSAKKSMHDFYSVERLFTEYRYLYSGNYDQSYSKQNERY